MRALDCARSDVFPSLRPAAMRLDVTDRDRDDVLLAIFQCGRCAGNVVIETPRRFELECVNFHICSHLLAKEI